MAAPLELDLSKLTDEDLGHLEFVLCSPSYNRVFRPFIDQIRADYLRLLLDPSKERQARIPDDYIRGGVAVLATILAMFDDIREGINAERIHNAVTAVRQPDDFERRMSSGLVRPPSLTPPADLTPEEDY